MKSIPTVKQEGGGRSPAMQALTRRTLVRTLAAVGVLVAGIVVVRGLEGAMKATFDKPPAPLRKPLSQIPRELGSPVRYVAEKADVQLSHATEESLGTRDYLVREFADVTLPNDAPGRWVNLNVNYYPTGSSTPHVPEVCWAGVGRTEVKGSREFFDVRGIERSDGTTVDVRMRLISFEPVGGQPLLSADGHPLYSHVAYVFHVNGNYVASPKEVTSQFWKAGYRYAYHCKIEVTPLDSGGRQQVLSCSKEQAIEIVSAFLRQALPEVEACLPDPAILTEPGSVGSQAESGRNKK